MPLLFGKMKNLLHLYLIGNQLNKLPNSIGMCDKLEYLNITSNKIIKLPESIIKLAYR